MPADASLADRINAIVTDPKYHDLFGILKGTRNGEYPPCRGLLLFS